MTLSNILTKPVATNVLEALAHTIYIQPLVIQPDRHPRHGAFLDYVPFRAVENLASLGSTPTSVGETEHLVGYLERKYGLSVQLSIVNGLSHRLILVLVCVENQTIQKERERK